MIDGQNDPATYRWALTKAADGAADRRAGVDERAHRTTVHRLLTAHGPTDDVPVVCAGCGTTWPCGVVNGAVADLRSGPAGN